MEWEVEYTDEFEAWWLTLGEEEQAASTVPGMDTCENCARKAKAIRYALYTRSILAVQQFCLSVEIKLVTGVGMTVWYR